MTPEAKAHDLIVRFYILPDEVPAVGGLKGAESRQIARQCSIICVEQIIDSINKLQQYWEKDVIDPVGYWSEVLEHIKKQ